MSGMAAALVGALLFSLQLMAQGTAPSGVVTVRLVRGIDSSAMRVGQAVPGTVVSSNGSVPPGSGAAVELVADPAGGFSLRLGRLGVNGQIWGTTSTAAVLTDGRPARGQTLAVPQNAVVSFTLGQVVARGALQRPLPQSGGTAPAPIAARHPANTVWDVPAAAAGYPAMHATHDAQLGCWWVPFLSKNFAFEAPVQKCERRDQTTAVVETATGIALQYPGQAPEEILTVLSKPAQQTVEAAIKQQFIMKLKIPAARTSCVAKPDTEGGSTYTVVATGAYAKLKKFNTGGMDEDSPCPGLQSDDAIAREFFSLQDGPSTEFFFVQEDDNGTVFDHRAIRFAERP